MDQVSKCTVNIERSPKVESQIIEELMESLLKTIEKENNPLLNKAEKKILSKSSITISKIVTDTPLLHKKPNYQYLKNQKMKEKKRLNQSVRSTQRAKDGRFSYDVAEQGNLASMSGEIKQRPPINKHFCKQNCKCKTGRDVYVQIELEDGSYPESECPNNPGAFDNGEFELDHASVCTNDHGIFRAYWRNWEGHTFEKRAHLKNAPREVNNAINKFNLSHTKKFSRRKATEKEPNYSEFMFVCRLCQRGLKTNRQLSQHIKDSH